VGLAQVFYGVAVPADAVNVFFAYRDAPERRAALEEPPGSLVRYRLFGLDELAARGATVRHNLERPAQPAWARGISSLVNRPLYGLGGYGGDFAAVLPSLRAIDDADVVLSTVDTVGIPLILLRTAHLVRTPVVYVSIGLPERLEQLGPRMQRHYAHALRRTRAVVAYAESEAEELRRVVGPSGPPVLFVPFGVDDRLFRPEPGVEPDVDVLSIGVDPRRDFELLLEVARRRPEWSFRIVTTAARARSLGEPSPNVAIESDLALPQARERLASARVVALPVRDNSYSGATTTLLQAMAMARPVVVSRTAAIATGYGLEDGLNSRLVPPGDPAAFEQALLETLTGADAASLLGTRAREHVERSLSWERYTNALWEVVSDVVRATSPSG
jgi:glycosyltransferase involved in cell wall biosynthesis